MSKKLLKFIVIFLAILIIFCFIAILYGIYLKVSKNQNNIDVSINNYKLNLDTNEKIVDIDVIDSNDILFTISDSKDIYAIIFDSKKNKIKSIIKK